MENPRKRTTVATAAGGDGLHLFDHQQQQMYDLNTTSALVWHSAINNSLAHSNILCVRLEAMKLTN